METLSSTTVNTGMGRILITRASSRLLPAFIRFMSLVLIPPLFLSACSDGPQDLASEVNENALAKDSNATPAIVEKGMFFNPDLSEYALHNESDDDGDGDGVNETHVKRYINSKGDTVFSMTTGGKLWAWSLDTKGGEDADIKSNFVIRDSNCDGVFDERYRLDAEFHVPTCLQGVAAETPKDI